MLYVPSNQTHWEEPPSQKVIQSILPKRVLHPEHLCSLSPAAVDLSGTTGTTTKTALRNVMCSHKESVFKGIIGYILQKEDSNIYIEALFVIGFTNVQQQGLHE